MKQARTILSVVLLAFLAPLVRAYEMRTWTAMNGKTTEAAYVRYESDTQKVVMQKRDGSIIKVPRDSLSDADWVYVMKYDPSIFEIFVFLGETTCVISKPNGQKTLSKPTRFFASNSQKLRIVQEGVEIAEIPIILSSSSFVLFATHKVDIETVHKKYFDYQWGCPVRDTLYLHVVTPNMVPEQSGRGFARGYWHDVQSGVRINVASGKQYKWIQSQFKFGEIPIEEYERIKGEVQTRFPDSWITLEFDSRIASEVSNIGQNALVVDKLLQQNNRFARVSKILSSKSVGIPDNDMPRDQIAEKHKLLGTGSGFFITTDGHFLTNYHVVQGANTIRLSTAFGSISATVVRVDPAVDLALLKTENRGFVPIPFENKEEASLGEDIFTIGFPMPDLQGFSPKMTKGVISSLNGIQDDDVQYQIDASIQPGNSGGPLVNNQGELVGVVVATLKAGLVAEKKGVLPQNVNYAIKKKHVIDFLSQVPECLRSIQTSNQPSTGKSASPETIKAVQNSCAMVIVFE